MQPKIIDLKDDYNFDETLITIKDILKPGDLFFATDGFFKYIRSEKMIHSTYYFTISEIAELAYNNKLPILMYLGQRKKTFYMDHAFLLGADMCFLYDEDFSFCFPTMITILNPKA